MNERATLMTPGFPGEIDETGVSETFGRPIERREIEHNDDAEIVIGGVIDPHLHRAHSRLYWTRSGRAILCVGFLLPIGVRGGKLVEEPERRIETAVR